MPVNDELGAEYPLRQKETYSVIIRHTNKPGTEFYRLSFPQMTIAQFINTILLEKPGQWGKIKLASFITGEDIAEYYFGELTFLTDNTDILNAIINCDNCLGRSNQSQMDYLLITNCLGEE